MTLPVDPGHVLVGAIRWDAWYDPDNGTVSQAVTQALSKEAFHWRLPWFAEIDGGDAVTIDGYSQSVMDTEINLAHSNGIDYWAFTYYGTNSPLNNAMNLYLSSADTALVNFALIDTLGWSATATNYRDAIDDRVRFLTSNHYQTVEGGRPIYYLMLPPQSSLEKWWGNSYSNLQPALSYLADSVKAKTGFDPYLVLLDSASDAPAIARALDVDAISAYAIPGVGQGASYQSLSNQVQASWNRTATYGLDVVPTVMTGWDPSPRIETPVPWGSSGTMTYLPGSPQEISQQVVSGLSWIAANRLLTPAQTALIYAWDEFDEGGWLAPTYTGNNTSGDASRISAVGDAISNLKNGVWTDNEGETIFTAQNGDRYTYVGHALTRIIYATGAATIYSADGSFQYRSPSGDIRYTAFRDGGFSVYDSGGNLTFYNSNAHLSKIVFADGTYQVFAADGSSSVFSCMDAIIKAIYCDGSYMIYGADGTNMLYSNTSILKKTVTSDGSVTSYWADGSSLYFGPSGTYMYHKVPVLDGAVNYYNAAGMLFEVDYADGSRKFLNPDQTYNIDYPNGRVASFNAEGFVVQMTFPSGNSIKYGLANASNAANMFDDGSMFGTAGNDTISLTHEIDMMELNGGNDMIRMSSESCLTTITGGGPGSIIDLIGGGEFRMNPDTTVSLVTMESPGTLVLNATLGLAVVGSEGSDRISAGGAGQVLNGGGGADTLVGYSEGSTQFVGNIAELDGDIIENFASPDIIYIIGAVLSAEDIEIHSDLTNTFIEIFGGHGDGGRIVLHGIYNADWFSVISDGLQGSSIFYTPQTPGRLGPLGDPVATPYQTFAVPTTGGTGGGVINTTCSIGVLQDNNNTAGRYAATDASKPGSYPAVLPLIFTDIRSGSTAGADKMASSGANLTPNSANRAFVGGMMPSGRLSVAAGVTAGADDVFRIMLSHTSAGATITTSTANATIDKADPVGPSAPLAPTTTQISNPASNVDGIPVLLRQSENGSLYVLDGVSSVQNPVSQSATGLAFLAPPDLDGDGCADLLLQNSSTSSLYDWIMNGGGVQHIDLITTLSADVSFAAAAGVHEGSAEILLQDAGSASWTLLYGDGAGVFVGNDYDIGTSL